MDIRAYYSIFRRWIWLSLICLVFSAGTAYILSSQGEKIYRATATLLISEGNASSNLNTDLLADERLARTYRERINSAPVLEETYERLNMTPEEGNLAKIDIEFVRDTQLLRIQVEHPDPEVAQSLANTIPVVFSDRNREQQSSRFEDSKEDLIEQIGAIQTEIDRVQLELDSPEVQSSIVRLEEELNQLLATQAILVQSFEQVRLEEVTNLDTVILDIPAELPQVPIRPKPVQVAVIAGIIAAIMGLSFGFLIELLDDTIKASTDFSRQFGFEPLALIGRMEENSDQNLVSSMSPRSPLAESYRILRTNLRYLSVDKEFQILVVTSPGPDEGKSTTAANLAAVMAQAGQKVILVDADLRRPKLHKLFKISNDYGLTSTLLENKSSAMQFVSNTSIADLKVLPSGPLPPNPSDLVGTQRMKDILAELRSQSDFVIVDTPPVLSAADSSLLAESASGVVLVVRSSKTRIDATKRAIKQLQSVQANILGLVLNGVKRGEGAYSYYTYYYQHSSHSSKTPRSIFKNRRARKAARQAAE